MDKKSSELSTRDFLKDQLLKAEEEYINLKKTLRIEKKRLDRLSSQQQTSKQQIEFYTQEYQTALSSMKSCSSSITKDICEELVSLSSPSKTIQEIGSKTLLVLNQSELEYEDFLSVLKNFSYFKDLINSMPNQILPENVVHEILPIWKNQAFFQAKVARTSKCASLLAQWLGHAVEFSLKKSTVLASKRKDPDLQKKLKIQNDIIKDLNKDLHLLRDKIENSQKALKDFESEEIKMVNKSIQDGSRRSLGSTSHRRTTSNLWGSLHLQNFPNFNDEELYGEMPEQTSFDGQIKLEGHESIGCCRLRFFCF